ncbi:MAG: tRNA 2-selenouridine(34) synthase MnmH [Bdellovibrionales bacterium]
MSSHLTLLTAKQTLKALHENPSQYAFIDVRSEGEFEEGGFPRFQNIPLLNNQERHLVGLEYKQRGREMAIELGHQLVDPDQNSRISKWKDAITLSEKKEGIFCCWRGGLRSKISAQWAREAGEKVQQVQGGYKALRREILSVFEDPPDLLILAGWTGSGKTKLLHQLKTPLLDIEKLAKHRGSCFGQEITQNGYAIQPRQQSFENLLGLGLYDRTKTYLLEDESTRIGSLHIPVQLKAKMKISPVILLTANVETRARHIFEEYIQEPTQNGVAPLQVQEHFIKNLEFLHRKMGGLAYQDLKDKMLRAFQSGFGFREHEEWISELLTKHYDPSYEHALKRNNRPVVFEGDFKACAEWITQNCNSSSACIPK